MRIEFWRQVTIRHLGYLPTDARMLLETYIIDGSNEGVWRWCRDHAADLQQWDPEKRTVIWYEDGVEVEG